MVFRRGLLSGLEVSRPRRSAEESYFPSHIGGQHDFMIFDCRSSITSPFKGGSGDHRLAPEKESRTEGTRPSFHRRIYGSKRNHCGRGAFRRTLLVEFCRRFFRRIDEGHFFASMKHSDLRDAIVESIPRGVTADFPGCKLLHASWAHIPEGNPPALSRQVYGSPVP